MQPLKYNLNLNKRGSALLSALFIMTLVAIAATAMSMRIQLDIYRARLTIDNDKRYLASQAVTFWAMDILKIQHQSFKIAQENGKLIDFPTSLQTIYPGVVIKGALYDLQARFNLNNLSETKYQPFFLNLLEKVAPQIPPPKREALVKATTYWVTPYQPDRGHDEPLTFYLKQRPPYVPGFQLMQNLSEFFLIQQVTTQLYQTLLPLITALPEVTPINLNTASKQLLMSLGNGLNTTQLKDLLTARGQEGFKNLNEITLLLQKLNIPNEQITLESTYYLSLSTSSLNDLNLTTYTVLKRTKDKKGHISVSIVKESINTP